MNTKELKIIVKEVNKELAKISLVNNIDELIKTRDFIQNKINYIKQFSDEILEDFKEDYELVKHTNEKAKTNLKKTKNINDIYVAYKLYWDTKQELRSSQNLIEQTINTLEGFIAQIQLRIDKSKQLKQPN